MPVKPVQIIGDGRKRTKGTAKVEIRASLDPEYLEALKTALDAECRRVVNEVSALMGMRLRSNARFAKVRGLSSALTEIPAETDEYGITVGGVFRYSDLDRATPMRQGTFDFEGGHKALSPKRVPQIQWPHGYWFNQEYGKNAEDWGYRGRSGVPAGNFGLQENPDGLPLLRLPPSVLFRTQPGAISGKRTGFAIAPGRFLRDAALYGEQMLRELGREIMPRAAAVVNRGSKGLIRLMKDRD